MLSGSKSKPNIDNFGCVRAEIEEIHKEQSLGLSLPSGEGQKPSSRRWGVGLGKRHLLKEFVQRLLPPST